MKWVKYIVDKSIIYFAGIGLYYTYKNAPEWYEIVSNKLSRKKEEILRKLPIVEKKLESIKEELAESAFEEWEKSFDKLPENGFTPSDIMNLAETLPKNNDWKKGKVSGAVYHCGDGLTKMVEKIVCDNFWSNPLHADLFPQIRQMESDIIRMCANLYNAEEIAGCVTTGGSESIILACKTYRDIGIARGIEKPELVILDTAHAAFSKAAELLGMKLVKVKTSEDMDEPNWRDLETSITENSVLLVGSAPNFPYGNVDNIIKMAELAERQKIGFHMDACLGGFILPFSDTPIDFRVSGITSISMDTHKFGYCPKGSSVLLYRSRELIHSQYFVNTEWRGGIYVSPTLLGSRNGSIISGAWATMIYFGRNGYETMAKNIMETTKRIADKLRLIKDVHVIGNPSICVIAISSKNIDINEVYDFMIKRGWNLNHLQYPNAFHICITPIFIKNNKEEEFLNDMNAAIDYTRNTPKDEKEKLGALSMVYGTSQKIKERAFIRELGIYYQDLYYSLITRKSKSK